MESPLDPLDQQLIALLKVNARMPVVQQALPRRHEIDKLFSVSGRYDLCAMVGTESTQELDTLLDRIRAIKGVNDTFSTILLSTKLNRPGE